MTTEPNNPKSASPTPQSEQSTPEWKQAAAKPSPVQAEKSKMERFQRILRLALVGLAAVAAIFLAGFLTNHDEENLQSDLDYANTHIELLAVQVELKTAHIELKNENLAGAKVALSGTAARLETLKPLVEKVDTNLAANMLTRLNLILDGMDTNSATAQADLGVLAKNLQSVEDLLFGKNKSR